MTSNFKKIFVLLTIIFSVNSTLNSIDWLGLFKYLNCCGSSIEEGNVDISGPRQDTGYPGFRSESGSRSRSKPRKNSVFNGLTRSNDKCVVYYHS